MEGFPSEIREAPGGSLFLAMFPENKTEQDRKSRKIGAAIEKPRDDWERQGNGNVTVRFH